jgi:hypothetical protein
LKSDTNEKVVDILDCLMDNATAVPIDQSDLQMMLYKSSGYARLMILINTIELEEEAQMDIRSTLVINGYLSKITELLSANYVQENSDLVMDMFENFIRNILASWGQAKAQEKLKIEEHLELPLLLNKLILQGDY